MTAKTNARQAVEETSLADRSAEELPTEVIDKAVTHARAKLKETREQYRIAETREKNLFLENYTWEEFWALPDEEQERIWNAQFTMEIDDFEERDVHPDAYVPARQKRHPWDGSAGCETGIDI